MVFFFFWGGKICACKRLLHSLRSRQRGKTDGFFLFNGFSFLLFSQITSPPQHPGPVPSRSVAACPPLPRPLRDPRPQRGLRGEADNTPPPPAPNPSLGRPSAFEPRVTTARGKRAKHQWRDAIPGLGLFGGHERLGGGGGLLLREGGLVPTRGHSRSCPMWSNWDGQGMVEVAEGNWVPPGRRDAPGAVRMVHGPCPGQVPTSHPPSPAQPLAIPPLHPYVAQLVSFGLVC